ncbi:hypothetical protein HanRHA438_Chr16g0759641 [Helianthus annuus]|nr:hypothetical protein HanRHA438_Chr16g0759641 [Helianthus annuus]
MRLKVIGNECIIQHSSFYPERLILFRNTHLIYPKTYSSQEYPIDCPTHRDACSREVNSP